MKRWIGLCLGLLMVFSLVACGGQKSEDAPADDAPSWQEQYDLGLKFLSEGNYEEAIIAFTAVIEIDPKNTDAYLGLADAYLGSGDTEQAMQVLRDALLLAADPEALQGKLDQLTVSEEDPAPQPLEGFPKTERHDFGEHYVITEYNEFGNIIKQTSYRSDGTLMNEMVYEYDDQQRLIAEHNYSYQGGASHNVRYYGSDGRMSGMQIDWNDGRVTTFTYTYTPGSAVVSILLEDPMWYTEPLLVDYTMQSPEHSVDLNRWGGSSEDGIVHYDILEENQSRDIIREFCSNSEWHQE